MQITYNITLEMMHKEDAFLDYMTQNGIKMHFDNEADEWTGRFEHKNIDVLIAFVLLHWLGDDVVTAHDAEDLNYYLSKIKVIAA